MPEWTPVLRRCSRDYDPNVEGNAGSVKNMTTRMTEVLTSHVYR